MEGAARRMEGNVSQLNQLAPCSAALLGLGHVIASREVIDSPSSDMSSCIMRMTYAWGPRPGAGGGPYGGRTELTRARDVPPQGLQKVRSADAESLGPI